MNEYEAAALAYLIFWAGLGAVIGGYLGHTFKNRAFDGVFLSLLCGWVGWIIILMLPDRRPKCEQCKTPIRKGAKVCAACGAKLT